jgi:hypothetical protein
MRSRRYRGVKRGSSATSARVRLRLGHDIRCSKAAGSLRRKRQHPGEHVPKVLDGPSSPVDPDRHAHGVEPFAYMGDVLEPVISGETKGQRVSSLAW